MADIVDNHLAKFDLDLRKTRNGRFMDQKLTPDNLSFICDCIRNYVGSDKAKSFTKRDIWDSPYLSSNVMDIYSKPDPQDPLAKREYDKFVGQPLRLLASAGVLKDVKIGNQYSYSVQNYELLDHIALSQMNALRFLGAYLSKTLKDSGEIRYFENFRDKYMANTLGNDDFISLRERYARFIRGNTGIQGSYEPNRIFNKILNILAVLWRMPGEKGGRVTEYPMIYKDIEYNEVNWRDLKKKKSLTRGQATALHEVEVQHEKITDYEMAKAKAAVKARYTPTSEVQDSLASGVATQVHHIFPDSTFSQYRAHPENLILLTASQHNSRAHPNNNTQLVDGEYQRVCLLAKLDSISKSLSDGDGFYSLATFIEMINDIKDLGIPEDATINVIKDRLTQY